MNAVEWSPRSLRVLMVEDNPSDVRLVQAACKHAGCGLDISSAADGEEAFRYLAASSADSAGLPNLILLDINLPGRNGFEVLDEIRADPALHSIPVVILTSSQRDEDVERSYAHGANSYISKPHTFDEFCQVIVTLESYWYGVCRIPSQHGKADIGAVGNSSGPSRSAIGH